MVQSAIDIKSWQQRLPTVNEVRPSCCPLCAAASCPVGGPLQLHGHGLRERQVRGPTGPDEPAVMVGISARRYCCVACGAVIIVVPREVLAGRQYSASAIGFALALFGLALATAAEVRRRVGPITIVGATAATGWATLRRWARAVRDKHLFPSSPLPTPGSTLREVAASAAAALAASADATTRSLTLSARAFFGAAHAA